MQSIYHWKSVRIRRNLNFDRVGSIAYAITKFRRTSNIKSRLEIGISLTETSPCLKVTKNLQQHLPTIRTLHLPNNNNNNIR
ncbi:unnamed protein product [Caenorhabditis angaria]|uniref:Uncharacterized protein n=1 Tax=Caenorhabditis angaria TaxID=860376 RepID=A0A9P1IWC9_9PELO|nr:unnamed protein product [Caenorhabditis angaria]